MSAAERAFAEARAQGLPERIEDPSALAQVAELIAATTQYEGGGRRATAA